MPKSAANKVVSLAWQFEVTGRVANADPLVTFDYKTIKPLGVLAQYFWSRELGRWKLARVQVTGPQIRKDGPGTVPRSERSTAWGENNLDDAPEWVREFLERSNLPGDPTTSAP